MIHMIFAGAAVLASLGFGLQPAKAYEAPWCAVINTGLDVHWDCQYQSFEQCYPTVLAGNRGFPQSEPVLRRQPHRTQALSETPRSPAVAASQDMSAIGT